MTGLKSYSSSNLLPWLAAAALGCLVFAGSAIYAAHDLTAANFSTDSGDLLAAILTGGIPHPGGYPTYTLLGMLAQRLPAGNPYERAALLSSIPTAITAAVLVLWVRRCATDLAGQVWAGLSAGLAWASSPLVLSQATIVEVYALHAMFFVLGLVWAYQLFGYSSQQPHGLMLVALALSFGLGLGNHLSLAICLPVCAAALWSAFKQGMSARVLFYQGFALMAGLLVYLYLPLSARNFPPVNWGNPQTWSGFWWTVSAAPYQPLFNIESAGAFGNRLAAGFSVLRQQFGLSGLAIAALGAVWQSENARGYFTAAIWIFLASWGLAVGYQTSDSFLYLIPALLVLAYWIGLAVQVHWQSTWRGVTWGKVLALVLIISSLMSLPGILQQVDPRQDDHLASWSRDFLTSAPHQSILYTQSDPDTFSLWYQHFGLRQRPDVVVIATPLLQYAWYRETLQHNYPALIQPPVSIADPATWQAELARLNPGRQACATSIESNEPLEMSANCAGDSSASENHE